MAIEIQLTVRDDGSAIIQRVAGQVESLGRTTQQTGRQTQDVLSRVRGGWLELSAAIFIAERAFERAWRSAARGAEFEQSLARLNQQMNGFHSNAQAIVADLQAVTQGQLSTADAVQTASRALAIGLNPDQVRTFAQTAGVLSDVMGTTLKGSLDEVLQAVVTGRTAMLGNIGVFVDLQKETERFALLTDRSVDSITKQEKALILSNAIMEQAGPVMAKLGDQAVSDAVKLRSYEADWDNLTAAVDRFAKRALLAAVDVGKATLAAVTGAPDPRVRTAEQITNEVNAAVQAEQAAQRQAINLTALRAVQEETLGAKIANRLLHEQGSNQLLQVSIGLAQKLTEEFTRQASIVRSARAGGETVEEILFQRSIQDLSPDDQLQRLRARAFEAGGDPEKLGRVLQQINALGNLPGVEQAIKGIGQSFSSIESTGTRTMEQTFQLIDQATGTTNDFNAALKLLHEQFNRSDILNAPLFRALEQLKTQAADAARAMAGIGGGGGFTSFTPGPGDFLTNAGEGFATGSRRTRAGIARLHEGEAVLPAGMNFLDPRLSLMEREDRMARLATGHIPSFQLGTRLFSPNILSPSGDLPIIHSARSNLFFAGGTVAQIMDALAKLEQELFILQARTRPENFVGTIGAHRVAQDAAHALQTADILRGRLQGQLATALARGGPPSQGFGGDFAGGGGLVININVSGSLIGTPDQFAQVVRDQVLPELRRLSFAR